MGRFCPAIPTSVQKKATSLLSIDCLRFCPPSIINHPSSIITSLIACFALPACLLSRKRLDCIFTRRRRKVQVGKKKKCCLDALSVGVSKFPHLQRSVRAHTRGHIASSYHPIPSIPSIHPPILLYHAHAIPRPYHAHTTRTKKNKNPHVVVSR